MKRLVYVVLKRLVRWTSGFAFSHIEIRGMDRVPWDQPCIVSPNHCNAFLDALLVGAFAPTDLHYLSRASAFGTRFDWILEALQMVPVYRRRDGFDQVARNRDVFTAQCEKLRGGASLVVFSETEHAHTYHLRPLGKGSVRLALEAEVATDRDVMLVPVGINYYHLTRPGFKVSVVVGEPIPARRYADRHREHAARAANALRDDLADAMRACLLLPTPSDVTPDRLDRLNRHTESLPFPELKRALHSPEDLPAQGPVRPGLLRLARWISVLNVGPLWGVRTLMRWVDDPVFALSLKFAGALFGLPLWWAGLFGVVGLTAGWTAGAAVGGAAVGTMILRVALVRRANPPHPVEAQAVGAEV